MLGGVSDDLHKTLGLASLDGAADLHHWPGVDQDVAGMLDHPAGQLGLGLARHVEFVFFVAVTCQAKFPFEQVASARLRVELAIRTR